MGLTWRGVTLYTVGHSTRTLDELVALLGSFAITTLVDIRTVPRSRTNPQFNREALARDLPARGLHYAHVAELGGLRKPAKDSPNAGWRNLSFRGYADHMQSRDFAHGLAVLRELVRQGPTAIMCAEAVPWRCHRSLVADALTVRGATVLHLSAPGKASPHRLTPFAVVRGRRLTYPPEAAGQRPA